MSAFTYALATSLSILMHGLLVFFLTYSWQHKAPEFEVKRPQVVQATLVELEAKAPVKPPENNVIDLTQKRAQEAEAQAKAEAEKKRIQQEREKKAQEDAEKKRLEAERQKELEEKQRLEEEQRLAAEEQERRRIEEFNEALAAEEGYEVSVAAQEMVASVGALIRQQVVQQWSPPPSARRDMVAILSVTMVPTGRLVQVDLVEGSGNSAFDRSVVQAVQKAQPFDVVKTLDSSVFEQNFRVFRFRFSPQDLRL